MRESIRSTIDVADASRRVVVSNCLAADRSRAFGCANLRSSQKSTPDILMASQDRRTGAMERATPNDPEFSGAFFLRTKLLPPRPAPEILARPRLTERLKANLALPVTLV